ncbi:NAD(P)/FAD-dependent oxidoreductase [Paracnuella aquatica]|uniref:NAD(P)/FAD-dependent oxidoreductase n=1 Tax=Paracnuella aquatica TaxID=2268757 RepID=UPI000DEEC124|nr:FAD-binding oxidoreductase [Paracnuella aquatica]RPD49164.1 FAD-binding oxidoreductase [Paracnuella aquatica]
MQVDYLIIGQGIAGTMLSWALHRAGKSFLVLDEAAPITSSRVAAGIINPVTGRRFVRSWMIEELLPFARTTYSEMETFLQVQVVRHLDMIRFFPNSESRDLFVTRITEDDTYLHTYPDQNHFNNFFNYHYGCGQVRPAFCVDLQLLMQAWRAAMPQHFRDHRFNPEALTVQPDGVRYEDIDAQKIIFCEGHQGEANKWFRALPFSANKGEALFIECAGLEDKHIFKQSHLLAPLAQKGLFWVGSTYQNRFADAAPTPEFRQRTEQHLRDWLKLPFTVVDHKAAIRPATVERRPFVGLHPQHPAVGIFNGLGTKGTSLAPYFAHQFAAHLVHGTPITPEADVKRFERVLTKF